MTKPSSATNELTPAEATTRETGVSEYEGGSYRRPRRRRRWPAFLLALLLLLGLIVVVGDRVAAKLATDELRKQVVQEMSNNKVEYASLDVAIGGFPFLTQVARGNYDEITIDLTDVQLPADTAQGATLPKLHVVATNVDADTQEVIEGTAKVNAEQVTGTAVVSFATLNSLVDFAEIQLSEVDFSESAGGLKVTGNVNYRGFVAPISATADVSAADGQFQVKLRDLQAVNLPVPTVLRDYLGNLAQQSVSARMPQLPFGMTLDQVKVEANGLAITATGRNVPLVT